MGSAAGRSALTTTLSQRKEIPIPYGGTESLRGPLRAIVTNRSTEGTVIETSPLMDPPRRLERRTVMIREAGELATRVWSENPMLLDAFPSGPEAMLDGLVEFWRRGWPLLQSKERELSLLRTTNAELASKLDPRTRHGGVLFRLVGVDVFASVAGVPFTPEESEAFRRACAQEGEP